ncbi:MAG: preprotein translocase subunit SecG [Bacteroidetes bacterium]|jgi:preprotein translocase subunit SecG|nr:MAG: preprotein translocase subunit SecG [Bacteroidota bacterium]
MTILFFVLIVLACLLLGFVVLIQNPKGGGLSSAVGGFSNQVMGVKQTTDVLEKGTWLFAGIVGALCLFSTLFIKTGGAKTEGLLQKVNTTAPAKAPAAPAQAPVTAPTPAPATK